MTEYLEAHADVPLLSIKPPRAGQVFTDVGDNCAEVYKANWETEWLPEDLVRIRTVAASERAIYLLRAFLADGMSGQLRLEVRKLVAFVDGGA